jgi:hypothetical protein
MTQFTSNIMKVGAHLDDTRVLLDVWDPTLTDEENVEQIVHGNLLGLPSQSRANDVMVRALRPRFIAPGAGIIEALQLLGQRSDAFRDACYYELTRVDDFVAAFVEEQLGAWWDEGRISVDTSDAREWIDKLAADGRIPEWSPNIRDRVARGKMAALRDFGRLEGAKSSPKKEIARPDITIPGFAYVAYRLHQQGASSRALLASQVWRRWLLDDARVDELMHRLAALGVIYYAVAGSSLRIDWRADSLAEVVRAAL